MRQQQGQYLEVRGEDSEGFAVLASVPCEVLAPQICISQDSSQQPATKISTSVNRHGGATSVRVSKDDVAAALANRLESVRFEGADKNHPGDSYNDLAGRFLPFIGRLEERYRGTDANVLLISHGQTLATMLPCLLSNVDWAFSSTHSFDGSFYVVAELRDGEWVCLRWGEETVAGVG